MIRRARLERLERTVSTLKPDPQAVRDAFALFRETGELPEDVAVGRAVLGWAETGVDSTRYGDDEDSRAALIRAYVSTHAPEDKFMNLLRDEAVYVEEPIRGIARLILQQFAADGHDPTQPLFLQGRIPTPEFTCGSAALSMVRFPYGIVAEVHHERLTQVLQRFATVREMLEREGGEAEDAWFERFGEAVVAFRETGELPLDALMSDTVLADTELHALIRASDGEGDRELREALAACDDPDEAQRVAAVARLQDLVHARARRRDRDRAEGAPGCAGGPGPKSGGGEA
jgi:hypothetical protein